SRCSETPSCFRGPVQITPPMRPGGTALQVNSFLPVAKEARAEAGICARTRQRARSASSKIRDIAKRGLLAHSPVVNGCIGKAGNYIYEEKAKRPEFRVQSGPLLIIAHPAFRGVGATSGSVSAPSNALPRRGTL